MVTPCWTMSQKVNFGNVFWSGIFYTPDAQPTASKHWIMTDYCFVSSCYHNLMHSMHEVRVTTANKTVICLNSQLSLRLLEVKWAQLLVDGSTAMQVPGWRSDRRRVSMTVGCRILASFIHAGSVGRHRHDVQLEFFRCHVAAYVITALPSFQWKIN